MCKKCNADVSILKQRRCASNLICRLVPYLLHPCHRFGRCLLLSYLERMATTASIPAYLLPGVPVHQPPHLEGDASLATEILPGPPSSATLQQNTLKRDPKKPFMAYSYLPTSDPGSTYSGLTHGTLIGQDLEGPRSKRPRADKGCANFHENLPRIHAHFYIPINVHRYILAAMLISCCTTSSIRFQTCDGSSSASLCA